MADHALELATVGGLVDTATVRAAAANPTANGHAEADARVYLYRDP